MNSGEHSYNERIFSGGLRARLHLARFHWLYRRTCQYSPNLTKVLELGCYDAKTLDYLPKPPVRYLGLDANWENGLGIARRNHARPGYDFRECSSPDEMETGDETFDGCICMETFEHIPDSMLEGYLQKITRATTGICYFTVPIEIGPVFLGKYLVKKLFLSGGMGFAYSAREIANLSLGRTDKVPHDDHKGFDYRKFISIIRKDFEIVKVDSIPLAFCPLWLGFTIGIICRPA